MARFNGRTFAAVLMSLATVLSTAAAPAVALAAISPACPQVATTVTCTYLSGSHVLTIPAGVTTVHVLAVGGHGGQNGWNGVEGNTNSVVGHGAMVTADLAVTPGSTLRAVVGGNGTMYGAGTTGAGANGGGAGSTNFSPCSAGGGGGASDIRLDASLASRVLVAGGGGGAGCDGRQIISGGTDLSTAVGGDAGADGRPRPPSDVSYGSGGQAGCPVDATTGCGAGGAAGSDTDLSGGDVLAGGDGALGQGGDAVFGYSASGGGGGGGYSGGGAGGGDGCDLNPGAGPACLIRPGAGGGGGSSLVPAGGSLALDTTGIPEIVITFTAPALPAGPHGTLAPASVDFGDVVVGHAASTQWIQLTSSGLADLDISSIGFDGPSDGFVLGPNDCGVLLPSQWSCSIEVGFSTFSVGPHSATLSVDDDAADSPQTVTLTANGVGGIGALASIAPVSLDFGDQTVGVTSAPRTVTVTNVGTLPILATADIPVPSQGFDRTTACTVLQPGESCAVSVTFTPAALGAASAALLIFDPMPGSPQVIGLTGAGVPAVPGAHLDKTSLSFGSQAIGGTTASQTVTLSNTGTGSLSVNSASIVGSNAGDFRRVADSCTGASVAAGSSCTVLVAFSPTARGARSATLRFTDDAANSPQDVALAGSGVAAEAQLSVTSIDFGNVEIGTTSAHRRLTITNTGDAGQSLFVSSEVLTGTNRTEFAFVDDTCIANFVAAGASCTIDLTFAPTAAGVRTATFTITDNAVGSPQTVSLVGTGATPSADLAASISATPNPAKTGSKVTYTITIFNAGPSTASSILINDSLSSQSTFVSASTNRGTCVTPAKGASGVVSCSLSSLASGATQPIQILVTVIAKKNSITNTVTVSATTADPNPANNTASITTRVK
ncbi:MAG TPA: choice-of-anchor D domain-containing protein [Candidatus Limnocylindrales bacterium]|nr:choice-of-anchor D domain-containing protein [Candidatus Limnocylindrales bacterium]